MLDQSYIFSKGDVIQTSPEDGYYGIAVVLDNGTRIELDTGKMSFPMCHIAITPLIYDHPVNVDNIDHSLLKPLIFNRCFCLKGQPTFYRRETMVHIYRNINSLHLPVIGKVNPMIVFPGELSWRPQGDIFYLCGEIDRLFGREAYIAWKQKQLF